MQEPEIIVSSQTIAGQNEDKLYKSKCGQIIAGHTITVQVNHHSLNELKHFRSKSGHTIAGQNQVTPLQVK